MGRRTIFPDIERVLAWRVDPYPTNGEITAHETTQCPARRRPRTHARDGGTARELDRALMESIELHLRSDVPVGLFLSSGIDSATILAGLARHQVRVPAYTAGFDVRGIADERPGRPKNRARKPAPSISPVNVTESQALRYLPAIAACMDDPAADYAIIRPGFLPAARARM